MSPRASIAGRQTAPTININTTVPVEPLETKPETTEEPEKSPRAFFDRISEFPMQDWGRVWSLELYRKEPAIPGVPGSKGFLTLFINPITVSDIKQRYGGGKFRLNLCKNGRWSTSHEFDIEGEPKYDMDKERPPAAAGNGGTGNGDSAVVKEFITVLREELQRSREANQGSSPGSEKVIEMLVSASDRAQEMITKATPQATSHVQQLSELVTIVKALVPAPAPSPFSSDMFGPILKGLAEKLLTPVDPMAQITMFLTIFEKLDGLRGSGGNGGPKDWKSTLAQEAMTRAPEILKEVRETFQVNKEAAQERRAAAEANARALEIARQLPPAAAAHVAAAIAQPAPQMPADTVMPTGPLRTVPIDRAATDATPPVQTGTAAEPPNAGAGFSKSESDAVAKFMRVKIVEMITDDRDPEDVVEFIEDVDSTLNDMLVAYPAEMITTSLASDSVLSKVVSLPTWPDFLEAARAYIREIRAEQEKAHATTQAAPA